MAYIQFVVCIKSEDELPIDQYAYFTTEVSANECALYFIARGMRVEIKQACVCCTFTFFKSAYERQLLEHSVGPSIADDVATIMGLDS